MSRLGRVNYRESNRSPFLMGGGEPYTRDHSEHTAREIDQEVKRIIEEAVQKTRLILSERRTALEAVTQRLIEVEVIDSEDLQRIIESTLDGPRVVPGTSTNARRIDPKTDEPGASDGLLGPAVSPAG